MPIDNNIKKFDMNNCIYLEANAGDGGNHTTNPTWWYSSDIQMLATSAWPNQGTNHTQVRVHWNGDCTGLSSPDGPDFAFPVFDLFIGDPALVMQAGVNIHQIGSGVTSTSTTSGAVFTPTPDWQTKDAGTTTTHFCLLARCYSAGVTPCDGVNPCPPDMAGSGLEAFVVPDPHYAQFNLAGVPVGQEQMMYKINTGNVQKVAQIANIVAVADVNPTREVLDFVLPVAETIPGFKKIATNPLRNVGFDFSNFGGYQKGGILGFLEGLPDRIEDEIEELFTGKEETTTRARLRIAPGFFSSFNLTVDPSGAAPGDAHIYHVMQLGPKGEKIAGLSVFFVRG